MSFVVEGEPFTISVRSSTVYSISNLFVESLVIVNKENSFFF